MSGLRRRFRARRNARRALGAIPVLGARWNRVARRRWLLEMLPAGSVGAEIGVWRGDFTAEIVRIVHPEALHLIDPWRSARGEAFEGALFDRPQSEMDEIYGAVTRRFARHIVAGTVMVHRQTSADAAAAVADGSLDWVYIDGDHTYEGVALDLATYLPKVRPGGLVCGDDYVVGGMFKGGVKRAVDEIVAQRGAVLVTQRAEQFVLRKPNG